MQSTTQSSSVSSPHIPIIIHTLYAENNQYAGQLQALPQLTHQQSTILAPRAPELLFNYDFSLERKVLAENEEAVERYQRKQQESADREMRRIAPGLQSGPLKPTPVTQQGAEPTAVTMQPTSAAVRLSSSNYNSSNNGGGIDLLEFEQGLPPANPWDVPATVEDDLRLLHDALAPHALVSTLSTNNTLSRPPLPSRQSVPPSSSTFSSAPSTPPRSSAANPTAASTGNRLLSPLAVPQSLAKVSGELSTTTASHRPSQEVERLMRAADCCRDSAETALLYNLFTDIQSQQGAVNTGGGTTSLRAIEFCRQRDWLLERGYLPRDVDAVYRHWLSTVDAANRPLDHPKYLAHLNALVKVREMGFADAASWKALLDTDPDRCSEQSSSSSANVAASKMKSSDQSTAKRVDYETWGERAVEILLSQL